MRGRLPAGSPCPATLVLELAWDWASRSPRRIEIVGQMYAQAKLGEAPPAGGPPAVLQTRLGPGPAAVLQLVFGGAAAATVQTGVAGLAASLVYLSRDGKTLLPTPDLAAGTRRYRLTLQGLQLDHDAAPRIGLALWARGLEERAPGRAGAWSAEPVLAASADPRPPVVLVEREDVQLTSLADARGEHHAQLAWPAAAGAAGYFVYTVTETKLRADRGLGVAARSMTLSARLAALRDAFGNDPDRRSFTRVNAQPVTATTMPVTLPRGSKEIHLYMVLGVSAGQVESVWPPTAALGSDAWRLLRKRPIAYAAPQLAQPSPPDLEVSRVLDAGSSPPAWRAALRARTKPGAAVVRLDLYRVRVPEAALELDTMGPPLARITASSGPWTVAPTVSPLRGESQVLGTVSGLDAVEGSWRRVFYRAVAWAGDDPLRGLYGTRSLPSAVREVVVPPAGPPDLAALAWHWPGGDLGEVQVDGSTLAPVETTPLGDHRLRIDVRVQRADGGHAQLLQRPETAQGDASLLSLATEPPAAGLPGAWRSRAGGVTTLHLRVRRASVDDALTVRLLLSDPLGRATERVLQVPAGSPLPEPDLLSPQVTPRAGLGFVVRFATTVPVEPLPGGAYRLQVRYTPARTLPLPLPSAAVPVPSPPPFSGFPRPVMPLRLDPDLVPGLPRPGLVPVRPPVGPFPRVQTLDVALADIALADGSPDLFSGSVPLPVRRGSGPMRQTLIAVGLRGRGGRVDLAIVAPDGRRASVQLTLN